MKKKVITFEEFAKKVSIDPKRYENDTIKLAAKIKLYFLLYGKLGIEGLREILKIYETD